MTDLGICTHGYHHDGDIGTGVQLPQALDGFDAVDLAHLVIGQYQVGRVGPGPLNGFQGTGEGLDLDIGVDAADHALEYYAGIPLVIDNQHLFRGDGDHAASGPFNFQTDNGFHGGSPDPLVQ